MAEYELYCFAQSGNSYKAALMLNLIGADWAPRFVDFFNGETRTPKYRAEVNELGEAPVLAHGGRKLSQSGVILTYLSERSDRFAPQGDDERHEVLRWMLFDNHKFTSYLATYRFLRAFAKGGDPAVAAFFEGRCKAAFGIVEKHLAATPFLTGERPTIADISMCGYVYYPVEEHGFDFAKDYPAIDAWRRRLAALPGWVHPYELMPGHPLPGA